MRAALPILRRRTSRLTKKLACTLGKMPLVSDTLFRARNVHRLDELIPAVVCRQLPGRKSGLGRATLKMFSSSSELSRLVLRGVICVLVVGTTAGCSTMRGTPVRYQTSAATIEKIDLTADDLANLQAVGNERERNLYQNKAIAVIDLQFHQFVRDLAADRADSATAVAGTTLGASTAGAFVDSVKAKTNYALFAAGIVGAFGIVDKNYFYEKTVPALVAAMGASRAAVLVRMRSSQRELISSYDGTAALSDLEEYYAAGTLLAAISEITSKADADKKSALAEVRALEVPSDTEIERRRKLTAAIQAINDQSMPAAKKALSALGGSQQPATPKDARLALLRAMRPPTSENLDKVDKALKAAGLLK